MASRETDFRFEFSSIAFHMPKHFFYFWMRCVDLSKAHLSCGTADGNTELGVDVTFLQTGKHLVTASWVVEASSLHLCTIENIKHAHGVANNALLYPLLSQTGTEHQPSRVVNVASEGYKSVS